MTKCRRCTEDVETYRGVDLCDRCWVRIPKWVRILIEELSSEVDYYNSAAYPDE